VVDGLNNLNLNGGIFVEINGTKSSSFKCIFSICYIR
jgi:hypothetical protein